MDFSKTWLYLINDLLVKGSPVAPRGKLTLELPQHNILVDMRRPVLCVPKRKLSYAFMAAEARWILIGDNRVATIAPYSSRIADFSDDGQTFFGAYGPKIQSQLPYVVSKLLADPDTRQAGLTIWRENPPETKDVPCTIAIFFSIRQDRLNAHVFMRSSDSWLGVPYDVFNFSMLAHLVCIWLNEKRETVVSPGYLFLTAASSHLYETNFEDARVCFRSIDNIRDQPPTPTYMFSAGHDLINQLGDLRNTVAGDPRRWWEGPCA